MWNKLNNDYFVEITNETEVYITDFLQIWFISFSKDSFFHCVKASNPHMNTDEKDVLNCNKMLTNPETLKSERTRVVNEGKSLKLSIMGDKAKFGYPLHLELTFQEGNKEMFFQRVTQPLLVSIKDVKRSESELIKLLEKKDEEINEYKCEGGEIALRHLKTVPFDVNTHKKRHTSYSDTFGSLEIPENILEKNFPDQKLVKSEPDSQPTVLPTVEMPAIIIKQDIKGESSTTPSQSSSILDHHPIKKQRKKLNI